MRFLIATFSLTILACLAAYAGDAQPRQLVVVASKQTDVPVFSYYGPPLTDKDGDLFFHLGGNVFTDATIMKLSHSSWEPTLYKLPADVQHDKYVFYEFAVSPSGDLWMLANAGPNLQVVAFDSSGQVIGKSALDLSLSDVKVNDFAALDNDVLFFDGITVGKDAGHSFATLFDGGTGKSLRMWHDVFPSGKPGPKEQASILTGNASIGDDGNIYLLHESEVVAINPAGEIVKRVKFVKPVQSLIPFILRVSGGYAAVWLHTAPQEEVQSQSYLVLDLSSGKTLGWYSAPSGIKAPAMSFSGNNGFEFLVAKDGKWNLTEADLR